MITIDASVWVSAWIPSEVDHIQSKNLLALAQAAGDRYEIYVPTLLRVEVAAAITRNKNDARLAEIYSNTIGHAFLMTWVNVDERLCESARHLAISRRLRAADAMYAAVALEHHCDLVSLDQDHLSRLTSLVSVHTPSQMLARLSNP